MEYSTNKIPDAIWTAADVLLVMLIIFFVSASFSFGMLYVFGDTKVASILSRYVIGFSTIFIPILWISKRYKLSKEVLGLKKSNLTKIHYVAISIFACLYYIILSMVGPSKYMPIIPSINKISLAILLLPLSVYSFASIVLSPIAEEILWRGFVYGYLRKRIGIIFALLLQAVIFSLLHYNIHNNMSTNIYLITTISITGLIVGIIYEITGSIYPSMVFHCIFNFLSIINIAIHK